MKKLNCQTNRGNVLINHDPQTSHFIMIHFILLQYLHVSRSHVWIYHEWFDSFLMTARGKYVVLKNISSVSFIEITIALPISELVTFKPSILNIDNRTCNDYNLFIERLNLSTIQKNHNWVWHKILTIYWIIVWQSCSKTFEDQEMKFIARQLIIS